MLLKDWCKKIRYADDYKIQVIALKSYDDDTCEIACTADLYIDGEIEATEYIDIIENADDIDEIPTKTKRKAKAFVEYFKACDAFENAIQYIDKLVLL